MALDPITAILNVGSTLIDRLIPDRTQAAAAKAQLIQMQIQGDLDGMKGQLAVDQTEAASSSVFVAGWRPFIGWICGAALAYSYVLQPFIVSVAAIAGRKFDASQLPHLNMTELLGLLTTMMGNSVLRSIDKAQGTDNGH